MGVSILSWLRTLSSRTKYTTYTATLELRRLYHQFGTTSVQLSELGEEMKRNVPLPVFNALIDVFDMRQMIVDGEQ